MRRWAGYWGICYDLYIDTFISEIDPRRSDTHTKCTCTIVCVDLSMSHSQYRSPCPKPINPEVSISQMLKGQCHPYLSYLFVCTGDPLEHRTGMCTCHITVTLVSVGRPSGRNGADMSPSASPGDKFRDLPVRKTLISLKGNSFRDVVVYGISEASAVCFAATSSTVKMDIILSSETSGNF